MENLKLFGTHGFVLKKKNPQTSKALGHERAQFTSVGLFRRFRIATNYSKADAGAKGREKGLL